MTTRNEIALWAVGILVLGAGFYLSNADATWASLLTGSKTTPCMQEAQRRYDEGYAQAYERFKQADNEAVAKANLRMLLENLQSRLEREMARCEG